MSSLPMPSAFVGVLVAGLGIAGIPAEALSKPPSSAVPCGSVYTVRPGDTLFKLAERAYADGYLFGRIFRANRDLLSNSKTIEIGDELLIPCLDGTGPRTRREARAQGLLGDRDGPGASIDPRDQRAKPIEPATEPARAAMLEPLAQPSVEQPEAGGATPLGDAVEPVRIAALPADPAASPTLPEALPRAEQPAPVRAEKGAVGQGPAPSGEALPDRAVRLLSDSDAVPYAGRELPEGGMVTELIARAIDAAALGRASRVTFVAGGTRHLADLLAEGAFDVGFPWYKPDCSREDGLDPAARELCLAFEFSRPIAEVRFGYYARAGAPVARIDRHAHLLGKRLCRPEGRFMSELDRGLGDLAVIHTAETPRDCFLKLSEGEVDVVHMVKPEAMGTIRGMGLSEQVSEIEALESTRMLHAIALRSSPEGRAYLGLIDQGLESLMMSGKWFDLVASHQGARLVLRY